jgi:hypothetical protein
MGIAIGSGKIGFGYLVDGELMDWKLSIDASRSEEAAYALATKWIGYYQLDVVVLEDPDVSRKGSHSRVLHDAVVLAANELEVEVALVQREQLAPNKYAEAAALAKEFPQLAAWLPDKRRLWEKEPRNIILFEALALAWFWWRRSAPQDDLDTIDW